MAKLTVSIAGASGYAGGEALRLLLTHPQVSVRQITSQRHVGKSAGRVHPNLRKICDLSFCRLEDLAPCDVLLVCLRHGDAMAHMRELCSRAERIIDLSADFRLRQPQDYVTWYRHPHSHPEMLAEFVYGIPELHREEMRGATRISSAGCNATATILGLYPLYKLGLAGPEPVVVEVKVGSSEGGNQASDASHHPERAGCVRSFMPTGHRHAAEVIQELGLDGPAALHFSATAIEMVRGVLATCHVMLRDGLAEKDIWKAYRSVYASEPFVRIVKEREGLYRYPEPKLVAGTNYCDIGFEKDPHSRRLVVLSAIDNLMKGAAGQAVQALNIMHGFEERTGLEFCGLHP